MRKIALIVVLLLSLLDIKAAYIANQPYTISQPNGMRVSCFVSGDEFFNWIHDEDGYTIIQGNKDAWYYYAMKRGETIMESSYRVGEVDPRTISELTPWTKISKEEYQRRRDLFYSSVKDISPKVNPSGVFNNIVIYIRFAGESEIATPRSSYDNVMNNPLPNSLKSYFAEASYGALTINSTHYPSCSSPTTTNASYQDSHPRGYFQPYNATNNPSGYTNENARSSREQKLLADAVTWINANSPIPADLNIDNDIDGKVDNVCFMIKGNSGGWSDLLWAHRWMLTTQNVNINGKRVFDYTFQPENQVNWQTLCHEMFHAIGAPDLYHYQEQGVSNPVGGWDLMESGNAHMGAYMKWKYSNKVWISTIPKINASGQYWIRPLTSKTKNCYVIPASPNSTTEYFVVEFRKKIAGTYENNVPNSGLLIYRIKSNLDGNSDGPPDEVYVYRPFGTNSNDGNVNMAAFGQNYGRTYMNNFSNPASFLTNNSNGGLDIYDISEVGDSMSFWVNVGAPIKYDVDVRTNNDTWGTVTGGGLLNANSNVTVVATPAAGYRFVKWSEISSYRSSSPSYSFQLTHNMVLTAMFAPLDSVCTASSQVGGVLVPSVDWKVSPEINTGKYITNYVVSGTTYTWSLCPLDGGKGDYDSELSLFKFSNDSLIAKNDDGCGLFGYAKLVWTATFTGKVKVGVSQFLCEANSIKGLVAYRSDKVAPSCTIKVALNPTESGAVISGSGQYQIGETVLLKASILSGWTFLGWYENGGKIAGNYIYSFLAERDRDLYALYALKNGVDDNATVPVSVLYNSSSDAITLDGEFAKGMLVTVYDITGRILFCQQTNGESLVTISAAQFVNGIYIVELKDEKQRLSRKVRIVKA